MGEKRPQPTATLIKRLRRLAKWLDVGDLPELRARANTCLQAAARLELLMDPSSPCCEGCSRIATTEDNCGVPLCDECYENLDPTA